VIANNINKQQNERGSRLPAILESREETLYTQNPATKIIYLRHKYLDFFRVDPKDLPIFVTLISVLKNM